MNDNNSDSVRSIGSNESETELRADVFEDGSAVICPDCGGDLQYQNDVAVVCLDCETEFGHEVMPFDGWQRHYLVRPPENETVSKVIEATDDDDAELVTDGGPSFAECGARRAFDRVQSLRERVDGEGASPEEIVENWREIEERGRLIPDGGEPDTLPLEEFSHTTAPEWALKIADDLDLNRTATSKARQFARDHGLNGDTSRRPRSVASGAIYLAAALHNDKRNQAEVAEVADVSTVTVATCYQEIAEAEGLISDSRPDSEVRTDGGTTERPGFVDPNTEYVRCHFCGAEWKPTEVDGFDLSDEDEYYPRMVPACPEHAGGCR